MKSAGKRPARSSCPSKGGGYCANGMAPESNQQSMTSVTRRIRLPEANGES